MVLFESARLDQLCQDLDDDCIRSIVNDFLAEFPGQILQLRELADLEAWPEFVRIAHSMQGIAMSLGLGMVPAQLRCLEEIVNQEQPERVRANMPALHAAAKNSEVALKSWLSAHAP